MLAVEDWLFALGWAESVGGLSALIARADANAAALSAWVEQSDWAEHLAADPATRSNTSVCLKFAEAAVADLDEDGRRALAKNIDALLEVEDAAYDINAYRDAPPGLRIWCGATSTPPTSSARPLARLGLPNPPSKLKETDMPRC